MRAACIDIGSNTTRLLVADLHSGRLNEVHQERAFTRLGHELVGADAIGRAKIAEVTAVVHAQLSSARRHGATEVCAVATAAIRRAANGHRLVDEIRSATGLEVRILSDREEARLAFVGAAGMLQRPPDGRLGVIDVGGGSTEVAVGAVPGDVSWWASLAVGSGTLAARWLRSDPPSPAQLGCARAEIDELVGALRPPRPALTVAVGGSATSLCLLAGRVLDDDAFTGALQRLGSESSAAVAARLRIDPRRARLLPAGLLILEAVAGRLGAAPSVGRGGIREGVLLEAAGR